MSKNKKNEVNFQSDEDIQLNNELTDDIKTNVEITENIVKEDTNIEIESSLNEDEIDSKLDETVEEEILEEELPQSQVFENVELALLTPDQNETPKVRSIGSLSSAELKFYYRTGIMPK